MSDSTITKRTYVWVFIWLLALLGLTVLCNYLTSGWPGTVLAMLIATAKAILIVLFFMHVIESGSLIHVFVGAGFLWPAILIVGILHDYLSRGLLPPL